MAVSSKCEQIIVEPPAGLTRRVEEVLKLSDAIIDALGERCNQREEPDDTMMPVPSWDIIGSIVRVEGYLAATRANLGTILEVVRETRNRLDN